MELRWIEDRTLKSGLRLQYREGVNHPQGKYWNDVPIIKEETSPKPIRRNR